MAVVGLVLVSLSAVPAASGRSEEFLATLDYELSGTRGLNGWWRSNVTIHWIADPPPTSTTCTLAELVEGDTAGVTRSCTAVWSGEGSRSATTEVIRIDKTKPTSLRVRAGRRPDLYGWYGTDIRFMWSARDAMSGIGKCRRRTYKGPNDATASVRGSCRDRAGNYAPLLRKTFRYQEPLMRPRNGRRVWRPLLDWISVPKARYYNVQVWRFGQQILNRWPKYSRFRMPRTWVHEGIRYWMSSPGRYDWYVWPRFYGRYGKMVGHRYFIRP
jgi:hypothetical protein